MLKLCGCLLDEVVNIEQSTRSSYNGDGTQPSPFLIKFLPNDPQDGLNFPAWKKWLITILQAIATLAVTFTSSAFSGGIENVRNTFDVSHEISILGVSLFVLGFAIGPLLLAPLSEVYGRRTIFIPTYLVFTIMNAGAAASQNISTLLVLRFFAGLFGSSPLTNGGGVIADMFHGYERGIASSAFTLAPFLGPSIGPIVGGFFADAEGWRWLQGLMAIFSGIIWALNTLLVPETYAPVILRRRAKEMSKITGKVYVSKLDMQKTAVSFTKQCKTALLRPWIMLFKEPIVLLISLYIAIIYGTLFMCFAAFPIVFQAGRGWSPGVGGLAFTGTAVGACLATVASILDNKRYTRLGESKWKKIEPEARLPLSMVGGILIPVGFFWFAWTTDPEIHWIIPIIGSTLFAFGLVLVFMSLLNYLIDSYVIFAASVLAANSAVRSLSAAIFPLFARKMYDGLGVQWASSVPAFLALGCLPFPFLFYKYGSRIRLRCKYAAEAALALEKMRGENVPTTRERNEANFEEV